jgi:hypothetical protein
MGATIDPPYEGGCLCGAVRYRVEARPSLVCHCHCTLCRRAAGAPMVTWATVPVGAFRLVRGQPSRYSWSPRAVRQFCAACGSQLTFQFTGTDEIDFTVGTLDRPEIMEPERHVWAAAHLPWLTMDDGLPRHPGETNAE